MWRQIVADVFNAPVVCLNQEEGAAYGAALQAMWAWENARGPAADILEITQRFLRPMEATRAVPAAEHVARYQQLQALFNRLVEDLAGAFTEHRALLALS